jgi:hypothetical protein
MKNALAHYNAGIVGSCKFRIRGIGTRSQSYDLELQRQRCINLQRHE